MSAVLTNPEGVVSPRTIEALEALAAPLGRDELLWASGYLAGLAAARSGDAPRAAPATPAAAADAGRWLVLYGTETGNSRRVAQALGEQLTQAGLSAEVKDLRDYDPKALRRARQVAFVLATHGLGDPPEGTEAFFDYWLGERAPRLEQLRFSVLALGDSSYEEFCGFGREWDARLEALGAKRVHPRVDCDVDFEGPAAEWRAGLVETAAKEARPAPTLVVANDRAPRPAASRHTRDAPFAAPVAVNQKITGRGSSKDVRHLELSLEGSGLVYEPGDAIGVWPENPPALITALLECTGLDGDAQVEVRGEPMTLRRALATRLEITKLTRATVQACAELAGDEDLARLLADADALREYLATRQVIDLFAERRPRLSAQELVRALRGLTPRLYSVASSLEANPDEAHLCVSVIRYERFGRLHFGAASAFLADARREVPVYVEPNDRFRPPRDGSVPMIMIGAGTGVAPYRAFLQQRTLHGASGGHWLIYGDRTMRDDFLYQVEWQRWLADGALTRIDVAFSRDGPEKRYVQHCIGERAAELYDWLERGAHVYVCGDAEGMAPAVHAALVAAVQRASGGSAERAEEYLHGLKTAGRYQRDVY
ncbi:MAG TPA: assimilatory sulfite reductase (NADPH) flavoprotein subunit [Gammaproteobacteria bacterium]